MSEPTKDGVAASKRESRMNSIRRRKRRKRRTEMALLLAEEALLAHHQWCGFNPDAPGNSIYNRALRAIQEAKT